MRIGSRQRAPMKSKSPLCQRMHHGRVEIWVITLEVVTMGPAAEGEDATSLLACRTGRGEEADYRVVHG